MSERELRKDFDFVLEQDVRPVWMLIETVPDDRPVLLSDGDEVAAGVYAGYSFRTYGSSEFYRAYHVHPQTWEGDGDRGGLAVIDFQPTHWMPLPPPPNPNTTEQKGE